MSEGPAAAPIRSTPLGWPVAAVFFAMVASALGLLYFGASQPERRVINSLCCRPQGPGSARSLFHPTADRLAFTATGSGKTLLWVRSLDSLSAQPLAGTDNAYLPFWSPDSRFIGFFSTGRLKKIEASGGPPQTLSDADVDRGGAWSKDGLNSL